MKRSPFAIPRTLRIRGKRWTIKRECELDGKEARDMKNSVGMTRRDLREIHLSERETGYPLSSTLLHEILHACSRQTVDWRTEEKFIKDVEGALLDVLRQLRWRRR